MPAPPPPPPAEPRRALEEPGESSSEVTGYEADEDTDLNPVLSMTEPAVPPPSMLNRSASQRAPPPPPPTAAPLSPAARGHPERAAPPPPPSAPAPVPIPVAAPASHPDSIPEEPSMGAPQPPAPSLSRSLTSGSTTQRYSRTSHELIPAATGSSFTYGSEQTHAVEFDLQSGTQWWLASGGIPPAVAARKDVLYEVEESEIWKRGGRNYVVRDIYVLFPDYSQTIVTVEFNRDNGYVSFQQRVEAPPPFLRQDQLEAVYGDYGLRIAEVSQQMAGQSMAPGTFVPSVLNKVGSGLLPPVGNRSYGAVLYQNLANASERHYDEIRRGDIVVFRGARFQGHKGSLHTKYTSEAGTGGAGSSPAGPGSGSGADGKAGGGVHVGIVSEWDGSKRKIKVFEQPENSSTSSSSSSGGKIKSESYRLNDLKSGEVKVFRVIGRNYVGWD